MVDLPQFYDEKTFEKKPSRIKYVGTCTDLFVVSLKNEYPRIVRWTPGVSSV